MFLLQVSLHYRVIKVTHPQYLVLSFWWFLYQPMLCFCIVLSPWHKEPCTFKFYYWHFGDPGSYDLENLLNSYLRFLIVLNLFLLYDSKSMFWDIRKMRLTWTTVKRRKLLLPICKKLKKLHPLLRWKLIFLLI